MKKKIVNLAVFAALTSAPLLASAEAAPYLKLDLGMAMPTKLKGADYGKKPKNTAHYGAGVGYKFNENFRADITLSRMHKFKFSHTIDGDPVKQNFHSNVGMLNAYADIGNYNGFAPYVIAGVGVSHNKTKNYNYTTDGSHIKGAEKVNFAWNIGLGATYQMVENVSLDLGYRYYYLGKISSSNVLVGQAQGDREVRYTEVSPSSKLKTHAVTLGLRYNF